MRRAAAPCFLEQMVEPVRKQHMLIIGGGGAGEGTTMFRYYLAQGLRQLGDNVTVLDQITLTLPGYKDMLHMDQLKTEVPEVSVTWNINYSMIPDRSNKHDHFIIFRRSDAIEHLYLVIGLLERMSKIAKHQSLTLVLSGKEDATDPLQEMQRYMLTVYRDIFHLNVAVAYIPVMKAREWIKEHSESEDGGKEVAQFLIQVSHQSRRFCEGYDYSLKENFVADLPPQTYAMQEDDAVKDYFHMDDRLPLDACIHNSVLTEERCLDMLQHSDNFPQLVPRAMSRSMLKSMSRSLLPTGNADYILTSFFTSKRDPQRGKTVPKDSFNYMRKWYDSLKGVGLKAVIFHDHGLSQTFIKKITTDYSNISFQYFDIGDRTTNDGRFFAYYSFLLSHPEVERILCMDISDATLQNDPFELMTLLGRHLYIGHDVDTVHSMMKNGWMVGVMRTCHFDRLPHADLVKRYYHFYNAGLVGGDRTIMLDFLHKVTAVFHKISNRNCNMAVVNYVAHLHFGDYVFTGYPLSNPFGKGWKKKSKIYVVHK